MRRWDTSIALQGYERHLMEHNAGLPVDLFAVMLVQWSGVEAGSNFPVRNPFAAVKSISPMSETETRLQRLSRTIQSTMVAGYDALGKAIADRPLVFVFVPILISGLLGLGLLDFQQEVNAEKLFTPQDAEAIDDQKYVEATWGFDDRIATLYADSNTNALTKSALLAWLDAFEAVESAQITQDGNTLTFDDLCVKPDSVNCDRTSILDLWDYDRSTLQADSDVLATINAEVGTDIFGREFELSRWVGGIVRDGSDNIVSAKALRLNFLLENNIVRRANKESEDPVATAFEAAVDKAILSGSFSPLRRVVSVTQNGQEEEQSRAIESDVSALTIGYMILIVYCTIVFAKRNPVYSRAELAPVTIVSIGLAILATFGICQLIGIKFNFVVQTLAFVLLGIGVDDSFVIIHSVQHVQDYDNIKDRLRKSLSRAGVSITITSLTDLIAFLTGSSTSLPALRDFCLYATFGIFFDFAFQVTFFTACVYLHLGRQEKGRPDVLCCINPRRVSKTTTYCSNAQFDDAKPSPTQNFVGKYIATFVLHPIGQVCIVAAALGLFAAGVYGATQVETDFDIEWFLPADSYLQDAFDIRDEYFARSYFCSAYTKEGDYYANQADIGNMVQNLKSSSFVISNSVDDWYTAYEAWLPTSSYTTTTSGGFEVVDTESDFIPSIQGFLESNEGDRFQDDILLASDNSTITATQIAFLFSRLDGSQDQIDAMNEVRSIAESVTDLNGIAYAFFFIFWEGDEVIAWETQRNVIIAAAAVFIITTILLAKVSASFLVFLMIALVDVELIGFVYHTGLSYNSVTAINLILAVGLAVDYSAHICHAFLVAQGTRHERVRIALDELGGSVLNGGISTFLAVVALAGADSYIFRVFFTLFSLIVVFGLFHGLFVLPLLLSYIGPDSYGLDVANDVELVKGKEDTSDE